MKNWLRNRINSWLSYSDPSPESGHINSDGLFHLHVYQAIGGKILEVRRNDPKLDQYVYELYIVRDDANFSEETAKIISLEIMKS